MTAAEGAAGAEAAPAKLNLFLHLRGRRADGYHLLESLAVFPSAGDRLWVEPATGLSLSVSGPFGDMVPVDAANLVLRAAEAMAPPGRGAALHLEKNLPVAAGIGGGSSDAAAAMRLLSRHWGVAMPADRGLSLGADVPVCLSPRPQWMEGVGEILGPAPALPPFWVVLVNPLVTLSTAAVFAAVARRDCPAATPPPAGLDRFGAFVDWLSAQRNDLEAAAVACCPPVAAVLSALSAAPVSRMSGSGATCFAVVEAEAEAMALSEEIRAARPGWWVTAAAVRPAPVAA